MKRFCCGDVVPGCTAVFEAPTREQILHSVAHHARHDHGIAEIPPALIAQIQPLINDISAA